MVKGNSQMRVSNEFKDFVSYYKRIKLCKTNAKATEKIAKDMKRFFRKRNFLRNL